MKTPTLQWFAPRWCAAILLLTNSAVSLFGQIQFNYNEGRILAELILDAGYPPSVPTPSQAAFASFFNSANEGVLLNGRGQLADLTWNCSGKSPEINDMYPPGPCGSTLAKFTWPFTTGGFTANEPNQPMSIASMATVLPGHLPNGNYSGQFLLRAGTDQPLTAGTIDGRSVPYWVNLRHDLAGGAKHYYAKSFRSNLLLPHDQPNGWPVDEHTVANSNPIIEEVGALRVRAFCPSGGSTVLNTVSAFITARIATPNLQQPACDPPYPGWQGASGTVQASVEMPGGGLLDQTFLVRAGLSYVVTIEVTVYDLSGNISATFSSQPTQQPVQQGEIVDVRIDVNQFFCETGTGCQATVGVLEMIGANVFMDMQNIPPGVGLVNGPFGATKSAKFSPVPTTDPIGTLYVPAPNYFFQSLLPSIDIEPPLNDWPDTPYTPNAAFYFQTTSGLFEFMYMWAEPKMYACPDLPMQGQQEQTWVMDPGVVTGDIILCGPAPVGTAKTGIELITAKDLTQVYLTQPSQAQNFFNLPDYSIVTADLPYNNSYAHGAIRETPLTRTPTLFQAKYEFFLAGANAPLFSSWNAGGLILRMDQNYGPSYLGINDRLASGTLNTARDVYPQQSYQNDHNYCVSEIMVCFKNVGAQQIAAPQVLCQGSYSGADPLFPTQSTSQNADYAVGASYWGTPTSLTTGPLSVLLCLPKGSYTLTPSVMTQGGGRATFGGISLPDVGCKERINLNITISDGPMISAISECTSEANYALKSSVQAPSGYFLTEVSYTLNNVKTVVFSGSIASFNLASIGPILLVPCDNTITITAIDNQLQPQTTSLPVTITLDNTPPVLSGCQNLVVPATSQNGAVVNYSVTALDNCDGVVPANCVPPPGSFPVGLTTVTCTAKDQCENPSQCNFTVTVDNPCPNQVVNGSFEAPIGGLNTFTMVPVLPGWTTTDSQGSFELWNGTTGGMLASEGNQHLEINANDLDSTASQTITGLRTDCPATFSFDYRGRFGQAGGTPNNDFEVTLSGAHTLSAPLDPVAGSWFSYTVSFLPATPNLTISFRGQPHSPANGPGGAHIDNVSLTQCCTDCVPPPTDMVNWWTFDEKKGITASDIAGVKANNGNLHPANSTVPSHVPGMVGRAVCFNGSDQWMHVASQSEVDFTGTCPLNNGAESFTIDAWIKPAQPAATAMLLDKRHNDTLRGYALSLQNGFLRVELNDASVNAYVGNYPLSANQWHFIAVSYERCANELKLYVDGNPADTFTTPSLGNISTHPGTALLVARSQPMLAGNFFEGCLDELEYFQRVLPPSEIQSLWLAGSAGKCKPGADLPHRQLAATSAADGQLALKWSGDDAWLQAADTINGPWITLESATSGFRADMADPRKFYRLIYP